MKEFEILLLNCIYVLFPVIIYLFYFAYTKTFDKEANYLILDFCLLTSFYLVYRFGNVTDYKMILLVLNIPLLIAYLNKRKMVAIVLSILLINYYYSLSQTILIFVIIEYVLYYILYLLMYKKNISLFKYLFIILKGLATFIYFVLLNSNIYIALLYVLLFWILNYLIIYILDKGEDIIKLEMSFKELQKEKQIRTSLFKITHEIKNPIAVCKGYLDMFDVNNKKHSRKYIPIIRSEINRTLLLLQDFLDCNKLKINKEFLDINLLLEDVSDECMPLMIDKNIEYVFLNNEDDEIYIEGDYERLKQVFLNIIKNSIEASTGCDSYIKLSYTLNKNSINIVVKDNGHGMSKDSLEKIKTPFYTTKSNGTGLGITLSTEIIHAHGGIIHYTSKEGNWTKVNIKLPLKK